MKPGARDPMRLVSVYRTKHAATTLFKLLQSRGENVSISHKKPPDLQAHYRFVRSAPYKRWEFILVDTQCAGAIYLTDKQEIGIHLFPEFQDKGYGSRAIKDFMKRYPSERFLANINPKNKRAAHVLETLGFKLLQHTYEKINEPE